MLVRVKMKKKPVRVKMKRKISFVFDNCLFVNDG